MAIVGLQFSYQGSDKHETFRFYSRRLRSFLRWHRGNVAWVKGSIGKRAAYLILDSKLVKRAMRMFRQQMENGGQFFARIVNPYWVARQFDELDRVILGWISQDGINLGNEAAIFCPQKGHEEISTEKCQGLERGFRCPCWVGNSCNYPQGYDWLENKVKSGATPEQILGRRERA